MKKSVLAIILIMMIFLTGCDETKHKNNGEVSSNDKTTSSQPQNSENSDSIWDDLSWDSSSSSDEENKASYEEVIPSTNTAYFLNSISGGADKEADALRNAINNTKDELEIKGQKYYVSPNGDDNNDGKTPETAWKTVDSALSSSFLFNEGDAILLERGGIYRLNSAFVCKSGMTYGAYGEGEKPVIYGSSQNYAWGKLWEPSKKRNVWKLTLEKGDAGIIVFDHGKNVGAKKTNVSSLKSEGDFYHNIDDGILYLYVEGAYPNVKYKSIEIGTNTDIMTVPQKAKNVTIDNLSLKYGGTHGISVAANTSNIKITNCEVGWIGGSYTDPINNPGVRYGNGIQFWLSCDNMIVDNCWIYQVFDTGFSFQGTGKDSPQTYKNISVTNTLIEFCSMSIEIWDHTTDKSSVENVDFSNNILRFSGYGWGEQRGNFDYATHFTDYGSPDDYSVINMSVKNNIFDCSTQNLVYLCWDEGIERGITVSGNSFYQKASGYAINYGTGGQMTASNKKELIEAVKTFDPNPKTVEWVS